MKKNNKAYILIALALLAVLVIAWQTTKNQKPTTALDSFAQCLTDKGVAMYGADWCPHCQNQKKSFAKSFRFIKYIECPKDINLCLAKGIQSYPTWIVGDKKYEGEQNLDQLARASGCALPQSQ